MVAGGQRNWGLAVPAGGRGRFRLSALGVGQICEVASGFCWWQTDSSFGMLLSSPDASSLATGGSIKSIGWTQLAEIMRTMRPDLEKKP